MIKKTEETSKEQHIQKDGKDIKIEELTNLIKRVQADFENYKKRVEKERKEFISYTSKDFIQSLLPLLNSFELALKNTASKEDFIKGIELIYAQLLGLLECHSVKKIESVGKKFDPFYHEVLLQELSEKEEGIILEELQPGYMMKDCVLRYSKVKTAKNNGNNNKANAVKQNP